MDLTHLLLIAAEDLAGVPFGTTVKVQDRVLVTPLAEELARQRHIVIERAARALSELKDRRRIAVGADHGGFEIKEALKRFLDRMGLSYVDMGTHSTDAVDYPDFAQAVASAVARGAADLGIVVDGAGIGSCMAANKVPGIRAAMCYDEASARNSREHNGANVLTLGGKAISEDQMCRIVRVWLSSELTEDRHRRRVAKIDAMLPP